MISLIVALCFIIVLLIYTVSSDKGDNKNIRLSKKHKKKKEIINSNKKVIIKSEDGLYLGLEKQTRFFSLCENIYNAEPFSIIVHPKKRISLKTRDSYYMNMHYTTLPKNEYDVVARMTKPNNPSKFKLLKAKRGYYIRFYNGQYMCIDPNNILFSSNDKTKIFYFKFIKITEE